MNGKYAKSSMQGTVPCILWVPSKFGIETLIKKKKKTIVMLIIRDSYEELCIGLSSIQHALKKTYSQKTKNKKKIQIAIA